MGRGWSRNASPEALIAPVPFSGSLLWDLLSQDQIQLMGQLPWRTSKPSRGSGSLMQAPGAFPSPCRPGAASPRGHGLLEAGLG